MAAQVYPIGVGMFTPMVTVPMAGEAQGVADMAAPQLVMLANVALTSEGAGCECLAEEKQMVELKTVGSGTYSDSEDESLARYGGYEGEAGTPVGLYPEPQPVQLAQPTPQHPEEERIVTPPALGEETCREQGAASPPERAPSPAGMAKRKRVQRSAEPPKKKKPFHCKPCQYQAECEEEFIHHIRRHSAKKLIVVGGADGGEEPAQEASAASEGGDGLVYAKGVIRCERCGYNTNRYDHYVAHLKHHTKEGDSQRVYKCTICTYTTVSQYHWKKHLRNHFPSKLYTCSQCCYFSDRKNNYVQHIRTHTGERPFRCPYCKYSSSQKTHLTRHMRTHSGERPFKCETCSYLAANQHEVTRHARQVHNGPKPLSCPHCQYKTADRSNYKKHVELHINPRQFLCPVCTYAASKKCNLQYHIKSRHRDCADITMDVSKVKLRIKKPDSGSTYYKVDGDTQYVLTGIKDQKGQVEKKVTKQATGTTDKQREASPINLSTKKASKPAGLPPLDKERKDKAPKRGDQATEKATVEDKGAEKQTSQRAEKVERREKSSGRTEKSRGERAEQEGKRCEGHPERVEKKREKEARKPGRASKTAENSEGKAPPKRGRKPGKSPIRAGEKERAEKVEEDNRATSERMEQERAEKERAEKERVEKERMEKERAQKERVEKERAEKERVEKERAEKERVEKERAEKERVEKERAEKERVEKERVEKERVEKERAEAKNRKTVKSVKRSYQKLAKVMKERVDTDQGTTEESQKGSEKSERREGSAVGKRKVPEVELPEQDPTASEQPTVPRKSKRKKEEEKPPQAGGLLRRGRKPKATCQATRSTPAKGLDGPAAAQTRSKKGPGKRKQSSGPVESGARDGHAECSPVDDKQQLGGDSLSEVLPKPQASNPRSSTDTRDAQVGEAEEHQAEEGRTATACAEASGPPKTRDTSRQRAEPGCPLGLPGTAHKPADTEEDEGIHSHEGSDISDNVSEGSDDSGLSGSGKLAGPETPTEGPAPALAAPSSHTCIFCDRTFPLEAEYRRHLNRHLVNVYYLESAAAEDEH